VTEKTKKASSATDAAAMTKLCCFPSQRLANVMNVPTYSLLRLSSHIPTTHSRHFAKKRRLKTAEEIAEESSSSQPYDHIGPADSLSNILPVKFFIPSNETVTERNFRLKKKEVMEWNQSFWADHNSKFMKEKDLFIQQNTDPSSRDFNKKSLSAEKMSEFYRKFLNDNKLSHKQYNYQWYKYNISLLWPAFKVAVIRGGRRLTGKW